MFKKLIFTLTCLVFSGFSSAGLLTVTYTGIVTKIERQGIDPFDFGAEVNDLITGSFQIDLATMPSDNATSGQKASAEYWYRYEDFHRRTNFVTSTASVNMPVFLGDKGDPNYEIQDAIHLQNFGDAAPRGTHQYRRVYFSNRDFFNASGQFYDLEHILYAWDFSDSSLDGGLAAGKPLSFLLSESELGLGVAGAAGEIRSQSRYTSDRFGSNSVNKLNYRVTSIAITATEVATPSILSLFILGLICISVRRFLGQ
ncbi:hypothetical protein OCL06_15950 [Alteromonas sp. ASW11-19]|uniref:PEP-CTERM sorting domain-containing protein n=1 Tax=Alteromonas salexigens TaxID=2982530 RepID=A0ABT2VRY7_9ALTE|nr:hypothetical protein [Alteromonas salexigens]MCU7556085.1 hypothetical protein [Alteromonas salexigens]